MDKMTVFIGMIPALIALLIILSILGMILYSLLGRRKSLKLIIKFHQKENEILRDENKDLKKKNKELSEFCISKGFYFKKSKPN